MGFWCFILDVGDVFSVYIEVWVFVLIIRKFDI